ncbi:MAG: hypothetical protein ACHQQQ_11185 [Bacteroidota bacterium]
MMSDEEFEQHLISQLEIIDQFLTKNEIDLIDRPFVAADIFIKTCVLSVNGYPPDYYFVQPWFKQIIVPIKRWYMTKYGANSIKRKDSRAKGVVLHTGALYELSIPLTVIVPKGEIREFIFPKEILSFETETDFVKDLPNFQPTSSEANSFYQDVRIAVNLTRSINNNLKNCNFRHEICRELSAGIEVHVQKAVDDILSGLNDRFLISYWEIQLALEKTMKVLIIQSDVQNIVTHNLITLWEALEKLKPGLIRKEHLLKFPEPQIVMQYRYGKGPKIKKVEVYNNYINALRILDVLTMEFEREVLGQNVVFYLGKLPWQE